MDRITKPQAGTGPSKLAFHASRIIVDAGVLISMAAMSMPFVTTEGANRSSVAADALPVILLLAPIFLITMIPDHTKPIPTPLGWASLVLGIAAFPYAIVKYLDAANLARTLGGAVGFGARLLIFGTFVTIAGIGVGLARDMLRLPSGGTSRPRGPAPARPSQQAARQSTQEPAQQSVRQRTQQPSPRQNPARTQQAQSPATRPRPTGDQPTRRAPTPRPRPDRPSDPGPASGPGER